MILQPPSNPGPGGPRGPKPVQAPEGPGTRFFGPGTKGPKGRDHA